jgi:hypothetical protein
MLGRPEAWRREAAAALEMRRQNLRRALSLECCRRHLDAMLAVARA